MIKFLARLTAAALVAFATASAALAVENVPYDRTKFDAAQKEGKPILVDISAPWCPTCKVQKPIVEKLTNKPEYKSLTIFEVDFDSQKDAVKRFGARSQSTLIVFKGAKETGRSAGDTREASIETLVKSAF